MLNHCQNCLDEIEKIRGRYSDDQGVFFCGNAAMTFLKEMSEFCKTCPCNCKQCKRSKSKEIERQKSEK